jgi:hypothetical protein
MRLVVRWPRVAGFRPWRGKSFGAPSIITTLIVCWPLRLVGEADLRNGMGGRGSAENTTVEGIGPRELNGFPALHIIPGRRATGDGSKVPTGAHLPGAMVRGCAVCRGAVLPGQ